MAYTNSAATKDNTTTVFIGSLVGQNGLLDSAITAPLLADGNIGLDMMGYTAIVYTLQHTGYVGQLANEWKGTGSGTQEESVGYGTALGSVTVQNTGTSPIAIPIEAALFSTSAGLSFRALGNCHLSGYTADPSGLGSYVLQPGQTLAVPVEAVAYGQGSVVAANKITASSLAGLSVVSSTATSDDASWIDPANNTQGGFMTTAFAQYTTIYTNQGLAPAESHVNVNLDHEMTSSDLAAWDGYVDNCRKLGILNVAPIYSDSNYSFDLTQPFATSPWYANVRAAAMYSGGLAFDTPPVYWLARTWDDYQQNVMEQIRWCNQNGLRSSLIVSPDGNPALDGGFAQALKAMLKTLEAENALPSQIVVENYGGHANDLADLAAAGTLYDADPSDPNALNAIALLTSSLPLKPTASEAGLEVKGASGARTTVIMTGVQSGEDLGSGGTLHPFAVAQLHEVTPSAIVTVQISDASGVLTLTDGAAGQTAGAGHVLTFRGDAAAATAFLEGITAAAPSGATGTANVKLTVTDSLGNETAAVTPISIGVVHPLIASVATSCNGGVIAHAGDTITFALHVSQSISVSGSPSLLLSNMANARYAGQASDGSLLFRYTVQAGDHVSGLSVRALRLNSGSLTASSGLALDPDQLDVAPGFSSSFPVDTRTDAIQSISTGSGSVGLLARSSQSSPATITFSLASSSAIASVSGGTPSLLLSDGGTAAYSGISSSGALLFTYSVPVGAASSGLSVTAVQTGAASILNVKGEPVVVPSSLPATSSPASYDASGPVVLPDTISLALSEDAFQGNAVADILLDGQPYGGPIEIAASHSAGATQTVTLDAAAGAGVHDVSVSFTNDLWQGTPTTDRNLYVDGITVDGQSEGQAATLLTTSTNTQRIVVPPSDRLQLWVSEDAYQGDAQFAVWVDGRRLPATFAATASHAAGTSQEIDVYGSFGSGAHDVKAMFMNDNCSTAGDRNLYIQKIAIDGVTTNVDSTLLSTWQSVTAHVAAPPDTLSLQLSEDAFLGDAQCYVTIDGKPIGSVETITALHGKATQTVSFSGDFGSGQHTVGLTFINDLWQGTPATDRNLYLEGATFDGIASNAAQTFLNDRTFDFNVGLGAAPSIASSSNRSVPAVSALGLASGSNNPTPLSVLTASSHTSGGP